MSSLSWTLTRGLASRSLGRKPCARTDPARTKRPLTRAKPTSHARLVCLCAPLMTASVTRHETLVDVNDQKCADYPARATGTVTITATGAYGQGEAGSVKSSVRPIIQSHARNLSKVATISGKQNQVVDQRHGSDPQILRADAQAQTPQPLIVALTSAIEGRDRESKEKSSL